MLNRFFSAHILSGLWRFTTCVLWLSRKKEFHHFFCVQFFVYRNVSLCALSAWVGVITSAAKPKPGTINSKYCLNDIHWSAARLIRSMKKNVVWIDHWIEWYFYYCSSFTLSPAGQWQWHWTMNDCGIIFFFYRAFLILLLWRAVQSVCPDIVARDTLYLSLQIQQFDFFLYFQCLQTKDEKEKK